ncbi:hypothetical protein D9611_000456 [Ephemerocybe angulata]|uniref:Tyrosine-protein kinase ephrin type A/B receptor-like domain-containing protein n=1 Tax=Ephemerocybe angulata TaxID=980116 RepID=A0A8H5BMY4_9AGAR|nr:hypothetical protein D9611_000456 [Tulosesus angulatus]
MEKEHKLSGLYQEKHPALRSPASSHFLLRLPVIPSPLEVMHFSKLVVFLVLSASAPTSLSHKQRRVDRRNKIKLAMRGSDTRCLAGTYSATGNAPCTSCAPGTYSKESGQTRCIQARAGYYVPTAGQTTETACKAGTYNSNPGMTGCSTCPPGYMCPNDSLSMPQQCSPGRYSKGGEKECPKCPAGYFNNIHKATDCCQCAAGWFNGNAGNTNCQMCSNQYPYSNPGTPAQNQCTAKPGAWAPSKTCQQGTNGDCPASFPRPSAIPRRHLKAKPKCKVNEKACPIFSSLQVVRYACLDVQSNLESCGDCITYAFDGRPSRTGGRDCSAIPFVNEVSCSGGHCDIRSCQPGYIVSLDGSSCVLAFQL